MIEKILLIIIFEGIKMADKTSIELSIKKLELKKLVYEQKIQKIDEKIKKIKKKL
jgi:hypothetical protein